MARKKEQRKTNEQFVRHMMNYSRRGALMQAFIMQALEKYADACSQADAKVFDSPMMNGEAWKDCALEMRDALKEHYDLKPETKMEK